VLGSVLQPNIVKQSKVDEMIAFNIEIAVSNVRTQLATPPVALAPTVTTSSVSGS
jgi:hypothetical protein